MIYLRFCRLQNDNNEPSLVCLQKELDDLNSEEQRLLAELKALQLEEKDTLETIQKHEKEYEKLCKEERQYWKEYTKYRRELMLTDDEHKR